MTEPMIVIPAWSGDLEAAKELAVMTPDSKGLYRLSDGSLRGLGCYVSMPYGWPHTATEMFCALVEHNRDGDSFLWLEPDSCWTRPTGPAELFAEWERQLAANPNLSVMGAPTPDGLSGVAIYRVTPALRRAVAHLHRTHAFDAELARLHYHGLGDPDIPGAAVETDLICDCRADALAAADAKIELDPVQWVTQHPRAVLIHGDKTPALRNRLRAMIQSESPTCPA